MKADQFDYERFLRFCEENNQKAVSFHSGEFLPVCQSSLGKNIFGVNSKNAEEMLDEELDGITQIMATSNDWIPYLEPWHGVGVYAEAFSCPFTWNDYDAPWTRTIVDSIEKLKKLQRPMLKDAKLLQRVLRTTEYFNEKTKGKIPIAATDTQSPIDTLTLICDTTWFLTEAHDYPDEFHRVLSDITDLIIEFSLVQRSLCTKPISPGHIMWSPDIIKGFSVSEDLLVMISPDFYEEFARPYNERIAKALGGVAIHCCGNWAHNFERVKNTRGITMVDLKISKSYDPTPCILGDVIKGFRNTGIAVQVRADYNDTELINQLLRSDMRTVLVLRWDDDPKLREQRYLDIKRRWETCCQ